MGANSRIEWTHHTFNPWIGCTKVSPACDHCYAETENARRGWVQIEGAAAWGKDAPRHETSESYWKQPLKWNAEAERDGVRRRVFAGSLCDVMEERGDLDYLRSRLYRTIELTPSLDWLLLTKRPQNFRRFLPKPWLEKPRPNVWGMTTVESSDYLWRIEALRETPFRVRGLSCEPLLGFVPPVNLHGIHWVIGGGESGGGARPTHPWWATALRKAALAQGAAFLWKQWGNWKPIASYYDDSPLRDDALQVPHVLLTSSGCQWQEDFDGQPPHDTWILHRMSKTAAGRELDGRVWDEVPKAA